VDGSIRLAACLPRVRAGDLVMVPSVREHRAKDGTLSIYRDGQGKTRTDMTMHFTGKGLVTIQRLARKWLAQQ
jgi:hypothetical protein